MSDTRSNVLSKVPEVTLTFWIIKVLATTLGETGGDTVTMTLNWGYLTGTAIFLSLLLALVVAQIVAKKFHPFSILGDDRGFDDRRNNDGGLRRSILGHWIYWRLRDFTGLRAGGSRTVVLDDGDDLGRDRQ